MSMVRKYVKASSIVFQICQGSVISRNFDVIGMIVLLKKSKQTKKQLWPSIKRMSQNIWKLVTIFNYNS